MGKKAEEWECPRCKLRLSKKEYKQNPSLFHNKKRNKYKKYCPVDEVALLPLKEDTTEELEQPEEIRFSKSESLLDLPEDEIPEREATTRQEGLHLGEDKTPEEAAAAFNSLGLI